MSVVLCTRVAYCKITVRSGAHNYEGTYSSVVVTIVTAASFVIIDLMNLNQVTVDREFETAWVEGGTTLGETYYVIARASGSSSRSVHHYGFSARSCPILGVGGHNSGNGFGLLSRKYGVAADNVVDALLVDANGQLLDWKGMENDVFWAIKAGGGGVWGIIYAWKLEN
ncbi:Xanthine dehydrogenase C subunit [Trema orientale]|uniref:Xanthine dehydrogenase C subunit n=1 Tax=Trema orientale TaxID=63057 RepID=A0A2P5G0Q5_TREOI|nr:Xanthine dehydrogenase C subunit [Trema orientale]